MVSAQKGTPRASCTCQTVEDCCDACRAHSPQWYRHASVRPGERQAQSRMEHQGKQATGCRKGSPRSAGRTQIRE